MSAVPLGDDLGIEAATDLKQHLAPHVAQPGPLVLDAGTVQRVHTASLQVLCSFVRQLRGPHLRMCAWWSSRSRSAVTAAVSPRSLPQSSTGRFDVSIVEARS